VGGRGRMIVRYVQHDQVVEGILKKIIEIKSIAWPKYSYHEHENWLEKNLTTKDVHLLLEDETSVIGYSNIIMLHNFEINHVLQKGFGVGNVCVAERGKGQGNVLMKEINKYIISNNAVGLLFCKDELVSFYLRNAWELLEKDFLELNYDVPPNAMFFNYASKIEKIVCRGEKF
jgi:hypothetical protein